MVDCQRKVENVFGSLQNEFIVIRDILLWKEPVYSFFVFCVLNLLGRFYSNGGLTRYCTAWFFRYNVCCIVLCVLLLCLFLWVLPKIKLNAAIQRGKTSTEEKRRFEEITLSYQRFCIVIAPVLKYAEPHWGELKKLFYTCLSYFLQLHFLISVPVGGLLVQISLIGMIHFLSVSMWIVFLCSLWMPWQYYGIQRIIYEILKQLSSHENTHNDPSTSRGKYKATNNKTESPSKSTNTVPNPLTHKKDVKCVLPERATAPRGSKTESRTIINEIQAQKPVSLPPERRKKASKHDSISAAAAQNGHATTSLRALPRSDNTGVIPLLHTYICSDYLMGRCTRAKHCPMYHLKKPYQWVFYYGGKWWMVNDDDNEQLETSFCDPDITDKIVSLTLDRITFGIPTLSFFVDFKSMIIIGEIDLPIKRLSTKSQAELPGCPVATKWCWYWRNEHGKFVKYHFNRGDASQELEEQYLKGRSTFGFQVAKQKYELYFKKSPMYQKNRRLNTEREVRRRPCFSYNTGHESANSLIWEIMEKKKERQEDKHGYMRVELKRFHTEYRDIESLFMKTMHSRKTSTVRLTIESIDRLENQSVWEKYSSTKSHMISRGGSGPDANERFLFHGTTEQSVEGICKTNFDWRMSQGVNGVNC